MGCIGLTCWLSRSLIESKVRPPLCYPGRTLAAAVAIVVVAFKILVVIATLIAVGTCSALLAVVTGLGVVDIQ